MTTSYFSVRRLALLALLAAFACVGRLLLSAIPNVQPVTVILLIITLELGIVDGIIVATLSIILSNVLLGMGIWTLYQILSFSIVIILFWFTKPLWQHWQKAPWLKRIVFSLLAGLMGYVYGFVVSLFSVQFYRVPNFWLYYFQGLSYDSLHALGNIFFWWLLAPLLPPLLQRIPLEKTKKRN